MQRRVARRWAVLGIGAAALGAGRVVAGIGARLAGVPPARYRVGVAWKQPVPMPDGVILYADHYYPRAPGPFPTILVRSPYGRGWDMPYPFGLGMVQVPRFLAARGYHVVFQTARGCFDSGGAFPFLVNEEADGRATAEWIAAQPWFNGALGMWGASYWGYVQWALAADAPPYLKALAPSLSGSQMGTLIFPDGAPAFDLIVRWIRFTELLQHAGHWGGLGLIPRMAPWVQGRVLGPVFRALPISEAVERALGYPVAFYREAIEHPTLDRPYWQARDHSATVPLVTAPVNLIAGWYDIFLRESLADYAALVAAGRAPHLTIGPWTHTDGEVMLTSLREGLRWFAAHLQGDPAALRARPVRLYVMGGGGWRDLDAWPPPARPTRLYLHAGGRLAADPPPADAPPDHYRYDPANPTPNIGGPLIFPPAGAQDQRPLEARPDVLCYTTDPLPADLEVIGPVRLELYVRSSRAHTDFVGRLCDVAPNGRSVNICEGLTRLTPGCGTPQPDGSLRIAVDLYPTAQRFRQSHRIRIHVASGGHPRWARNLGTGEPFATGTAMLAAAQTIYHDAAHPAALVLPVTADG
jgi:predicted acyl esterase